MKVDIRISMMVMWHASGIIEYDRKRSAWLSNATIHMTQDTLHQYRVNSLHIYNSNPLI